MLLLVGLGNPGPKYARNRHNVGFMAVDAIAEACGFGPEKKQFQGLVREGVLETASGRVKTLILKPQTYMNDSGRSVGEAARFFKIPLSDIVVLYDELDLAPGKVRVRVGGGAAGHNGIRSISSHLGPEFVRVRIGIGHPGDKSRVHGHVLGDFAKADAAWLDPLIEGMAKAAPFLAEGDGGRFMSEVALHVQPERGAPKNRKKAEAPRAEPSPQTPAQPHEEPRDRGPLADGLRKLFGGKE